MVGDESDGADHDRVEPLRTFRSQVVANVRLQPGVLRTPAPALKHETPVLPTELSGDLRGRFAQLFSVS